MKLVTLDPATQTILVHLKLEAEKFVEYKCEEKIVIGIRRLEKQLGNFHKEILKPEKKIIKKVRRSVYAIKNLESGTKIDLTNVNFLRGDLSNNFLNLKGIIGKKIRKKISTNQIINLKNII